MRIKKVQPSLSSDYKLMIVDDDEGLIDSISTFLVRSGYDICGFSNPLEALETLEKEKYDLLILDYFMSPIKGDDFVSRLREFDRDLYVILLTGYKDLAPPFATIKAFDIQAYCEKSHRLDQLLLLIESGIKSISQMRRITKYRDGLDNILTALPAIYQLEPLADIIDAILAQIQILTASSDAFILIDGINGEERAIYKGIGTFDTPPAKIDAFDPAFLEAIGRAKASRTALWTDDGIILPIISINGLLEGVIYIDEEKEDDKKYLLEVFASQVAALIQNAYLHEKLALAHSNLKSGYVETIEALRLAVDARDVYTRGHSDRVSMYAQLIGRKIGMRDEDVEDLRTGALFHDIGKIGISDEVLLKNTSLTDEEFAEIKKHPAKGVLILSAMSAFEKIKHIVGSHHERIDGHGYPVGLAGDEIPLGARIICVADAYDAMTSDRQYRQKLLQSVAVDQLKKGRGTQFDGNIVDCFISVIEEAPDEVDAILNSK